MVPPIPSHIFISIALSGSTPLQLVLDCRHIARGVLLDPLDDGLLFAVTAVLYGLGLSLGVKEQCGESLDVLRGVILRRVHLCDDDRVNVAERLSHRLILRGQPLTVSA